MERSGGRYVGTRVMVVDDDPSILGLLSAGLVKAGYRVDTCSEAESALGHYIDSTPDIAVLDVGLRDMSGTELVRALLRAEYRPILILSNHDDPAIVQRAIASGVAGYLVKPLSVAQLIPSLETALCRYRKHRGQVAAHPGGDMVCTEHLCEVMDRFPFALLIVDGQHRPLYRNAQARRLLNERVLHIDPAGRLRARGNSGGLVPVLNHALGKLTSPCWDAVLLDDRPGERLHAWVSPLIAAVSGGEEKLAAVAVFDAARDQAYTWGALKALYGLTRKETRLVNGLLQGLSLKEYCRANFVTANTVHTHLRSIFRKTGTNRQAELVRLLSSMFLPIGR